MHNRLIFRYHRVRAHLNPGALRGCPFGGEPTDPDEESEGGTQEGR